MVNIEEFSKRLIIVMDYYEISAAALAEKINVQRSSISHLLSGRNKPSLEFVLKILKNFPEVELYWLLNGQGSFPKSVKDEVVAPTLFTTNESDPKQEKVAKTNIEIKTTSDIERIVIFYKDGSFKNYTP